MSFYKYILLFYIIVQFSSNVYAEIITTRNPYNPYYQNYQFQYENTELKSLEKYLYNNSFDYEAPLDRLNRLETSIFGFIQQGNYNDRVVNLKRAISCRPKQAPRRTIGNALGKFLFGQMTGISPNLHNTFSDSYMNNNYSSNLGRQSFSTIESPYGTRYQSRNYGTGSSSSIRILD